MPFFGHNIFPERNLKRQTLTGTGGTIAGVGRYLKTNNEDIVVALADPEGSGLYNKANHPLVAIPATISHLRHFRSNTV